MSTKEMEDYLATRKIVGLYQTDMFSCFCDEPTKASTTLIKTLQPATTQPVVRTEATTQSNTTTVPKTTTSVPKPTATTSTGPSTAEQLKRVSRVLENMDIVDDVVVPTKNNGDMVVTDTPTNVDLVDNKPSEMGMGNILIIGLILAGVGIALSGKKETRVIEA